MSKTDKLWQAIGDIDDSFVVEASAKRPKVLQGHWGLAASVACFCLVIASVVFMRGVGLLTPATQPTEPTTAPITSTQPPETTKETAPPVQTVPHNTLPLPEMQMYNDLFGDTSSWYNAALRCEYATPENIDLRMLFRNGFDDESRKGTDEEWAQLKDKEGFTEGLELFRLPVHKMNAILTELFGITVADVNPEGFEGMTYLESTDCWYYQTGKYHRVDFNALDVKPTLTGAKVYYEGGIAGNMVVTVTPNGADGYRILSNLPISAEEKTDMERVSELFNESGSWYNRALMSQFAAPQKLQLREFFQDLEGVPTHELTAEEWAIFGMEKVPEEYRMVRLKKSMMDELLTQYFGITVDQLASSAFEGMTYLESTDCWYLVTQGWSGDVIINIQSLSELPDGRIQVNYKRGDLDGGSPIYSMVLQPNGDGYRILCNFRADDEMQALREEFDALFSGLNRYRFALSNWYDSPEKVWLRGLFETGFQGEHEPTDEEWAQLKDVQGFNEHYDFFRLPVSKMNEVLMQYFGITLDQMDASAFDGLTYLESTDCWYYMATGAVGINGFRTQLVEYPPDGTIRVYYISNYKDGVSVVTLQPYGDGYQILCNMPADTTVPADPMSYFSDQKSWQNCMILSLFSRPEEASLSALFERPIEGESTEPTEQERQLLPELMERYDPLLLFRATKEQLDEVLRSVLNITTDQLPAGWEQEFTYLPETGCYYKLVSRNYGYNVSVSHVTENADGTVNVYYDLSYSLEGAPDQVVRLQPHENGYYMLSNEKYVDNTGKTEEQIAMETLFTASSSWYGKALISYYETPEKMSLRNFFDNGFEGESQKPTDAEWAQLKDVQGFNENYDLFRLPVSKMNEVLTQYFGITVADMDESAFAELTYLESTDCWYYMATGSRYVSGFVAQAVEHLPDGTIQVQYTVNYPEGLAVVTIKPYGDGYRILSNLPADTTVPTTKPTMPETEVMQDIEKAWKKRTGEELEWYTDNLWVGMRYYGSYDGYEILFYPTESVTDMFAELTVGGCSFWHSDTFEIYAYRDGKFRTLLDAYDSGDISGDSVAAIYEIHKPFAKL